MAGRVQDKGLELIPVFPPNLLPPLLGDSSRIRQIMVNLIGNATKFTEQGQIVARLKILEESADGMHLRFEVSDTGIGMSAEAQGKIFQVFSQADTSTTRLYGGTGLGLSICKQLVGLMGGEIGVESTVGEGSTFWFTLCFQMDKDTETARFEPSVDLVGRKVLVVDDKPVIRRKFEGHLSTWQMSCHLAESGEQALTLLREAANENEAFELAILDWEMPDMGGIALARQIQADSSIPKLQMMLLSPINFSEKEQMKAAGIAQHLTKPIRQSRLYHCLMKLLVPSSMPETVIDGAGIKASDPQRQQLFDADILLVEDNKVNQVVGKSFLKKMGCRVEIAGNGEEALKALAQLPYDLVFMDCQMPVMDGFEATEHIRHQNINCRLGRAIPVIALTADVVEGVRKRCLKVGMNDYLSKPFKAEALRDILEKWLVLPGELCALPQIDPAAGASEATGIPDIPPQKTSPDPEQKPAIDEAVLNNLKMLQEEGAPDILHEFINIFLDDAPSLIKKIQDAVAQCDCAAIKLNAHSLKSSSGLLGATALSEICKALEYKGTDEETDNIAELAQKVVDEYRQVETELSRQLERPL